MRREGGSEGGRGGWVKQGECEMRKAECGVAAVMVVAEAWGWGRSRGRDGRRREKRRVKECAAGLPCK